MLEISKLRVEYPLGNRIYLAVDDISFEVKAGEFFTLLGPSGCGKTTTLRSVAGLETPTGGTIRIDGKLVFSADHGINVPTQARDIAMVFQSYAIWPHMTVYENVVFPLDAKGVRRAVARPKVEAALQLVGLSEYARRPATQLSGGQQQRVALARALVKEAKVLLLDEPLSNLDAKLREQMRREMRELQRRIGTTTLYVTHDQEEALSLSDRIAVINGGRIVEIGTPIDLYLSPRHPFTAQFLGEGDLLPCTVLGRAGRYVRVRTKVGDLLADVRPELADHATHVLIRPECVQVLENAGTGENVLEGTIVNMAFSGKAMEYEVEVQNDHRMRVHAPPSVPRAIGSHVWLHVPPERCVLLAGTTEEVAHGLKAASVAPAMHLSLPNEIEIDLHSSTRAIRG